MSGPWLVSYVVLWGVVLFQGLVIFVLLRQMGLMYLGTAQGVARDGLAPGTKAPDFTLSDLAGNLVSLADFRGRRLLLIFGSTTCGPCRALVPDLNAFARERASEFATLFLIYGDTTSGRRFVDELGLETPHAVHMDADLADKYKARVTPFAFVIDGEGVVRSKGLANNREHLEMLERMANEELQRGKRNGVIAASEIVEEVRR
jgi:methylamine dehydrogenase accessory protein MauD